MSEILQIGFFSAKSVATVLFIALGGVVLVRGRFLKEESLKVLGQCVFAVMLPCLLFTKVSEKVDLEALSVYWVVPVACITFVLLGLLLGYGTSKALNYPANFRLPGTAASTFANISFIPIPLVTAMAMAFPVFATKPGSAAQGILYVSLYLMVYSPLLWSIGMKMISAKAGDPINLKEVFNPPIIGMTCGILVGTLPFLKAFFVGRGAPLEPLFTAASIVGDAAVPCAIIVLGGKLAYGPTHCSLPLRVLLGINGVKLLLLPLCALGIVWCATRLGILPRDPLLCTVLVIEAAVPPATNISIICSMSNNAIERDMSCVLFWGYLGSIPGLAVFIASSMWLFS